MATEFQLMKNPVLPLFTHAWNKDKTQVCVSPGDNKAHIYSFDGKNYKLEHTLEDHTATITGIDWSAESNDIVTCGHDRNAYVYCWKKNDAGVEVWDPKLVILRINRAATCVKWSPNGKKFAVGSGARVISVCYFEEDNDWWVSKHIKRPIRSTILSIDWHPNNYLLAAGSADFKCRIFSAAVKGVDEKNKETEWGARKKFGEVVQEFSTSTAGGWVHAVSFSQDGTKVAFAAHDSCVYVVDATDNLKMHRLPCKALPYRTIEWVSATEFVAAGFDYVPALFSFTGALQYIGELDTRQEKETKSTFRALDKFRNLDSKGTTEGSALKTKVNTTHQNCIADLQIFAGEKGNVAKFTTVGSDGKIVVWDLAAAKRSMPSSAA
ncbi:hypothetical protein PTSG_10429 [Salpingoeca rosetta]|uniref:Actin-related protein 2/3 complex subunit n=1 Tax=Salpingoeca rosetta (strain ATCC 50818 / BSB-021) TaxID=946362 RepID=F2UPM5_SALR5|nr:uncharacterized protein PTSG_10429 [Salpingoeca rosetta]EGD79580.1 hypothetical protein PTSG_10429 [Salpingoeca rosetta]|eukprot:XP_004988808.1 hypothetical protein PTSG_10429 [Salpingoeca rosetta]